MKKQIHLEFKDKAAKKTEFLSLKYSKYYEEYKKYGGFPGVVEETDYARKEEILLDIFNSYFQKDVVTLSDFDEIPKLRDLIYLLISRIGSRVDISKISSFLDVSREKIYQYLLFLESTYFIQLVKRLGRHDKQVSGGNKYYLCDTGLSRVLGELSAGQQLENSVFQNLRPSFNINYYQSKAGGEVDFILDKKIGLEVKQTASLSDIANLRKRVEMLKLQESYVVSETFVDFDEVIMPWDL